MYASTSKPRDAEQSYDEMYDKSHLFQMKAQEASAKPKQRMPVSQTQTRSHQDWGYDAVAGNAFARAGKIAGNPGGSATYMPFLGADKMIGSPSSWAQQVVKDTFESPKGQLQWDRAPQAHSQPMAKKPAVASSGRNATPWAQEIDFLQKAVPTPTGVTGASKSGPAAALAMMQNGGHSSNYGGGL